jgi:hypothetical protein
MVAKYLAFEFVDLVKVYRNGQELRESMPRWLAEIAIGCIPHEEPEVARAWIEPIRIEARAWYPAKQVPVVQSRRIALYLSTFLEPRLVA